MTSELSSGLLSYYIDALIDDFNDYFWLLLCLMIIDG